MQPCVFCLDTGVLRDEQVLLRSEHLYVCAPRGQLVEGFLAVAPVRCVSTFATVPREWFAELTWLRQSIERFYSTWYSGAGSTVYEQGRGGGGAVADRVDGFPLHAHLCLLPVAVDLHAELATRFAGEDVADPRDIAGIAQREPYLYVECTGRRTVYVARERLHRAALETSRLKPMLARLIGKPERGRWRDQPGDAELDTVIRKWNQTRLG